MWDTDGAKWGKLGCRICPTAPHRHPTHPVPPSPNSPLPRTLGCRVASPSALGDSGDPAGSPRQLTQVYLQPARCVWHPAIRWYRLISRGSTGGCGRGNRKSKREEKEEKADVIFLFFPLKGLIQS